MGMVVSSVPDSVAKSSRMNTYEKRPRKSFTLHAYEKQGRVPYHPVR